MNFPIFPRFDGGTHRTKLIIRKKEPHPLEAHSVIDLNCHFEIKEEDLPLVEKEFELWKQAAYDKIKIKYGKYCNIKPDFS